MFEVSHGSTNLNRLLGLLNQVKTSTDVDSDERCHDDEPLVLTISFGLKNDCSRSLCGVFLLLDPVQAVRSGQLPSMYS